MKFSDVRDVVFCSSWRDIPVSNMIFPVLLIFAALTPNSAANAATLENNTTFEMFS